MTVPTSFESSSSSNITEENTNNFKSSTCENTLLDTFQFRFDDLFKNLSSVSQNETMPAIVTNSILRYQDMIRSKIEDELNKLNISLLEDNRESVNASTSITKIGETYFQHTKKSIFDFFASRPWLIKETRNLTIHNGTFVNRQRKFLRQFHNLFGKSFQQPKQIEYNNTFTVWQNLVSTYTTISDVAKNSILDGTIFEMNNVFKTSPMNSIESNISQNVREQTSTNKTTPSNNVVTWLKSNIEIQSNKFMNWIGETLNTNSSSIF